MRTFIIVVRITSEASEDNIREYIERALEGGYDYTYLLRSKGDPDTNVLTSHVEEVMP